MTYKETGKFNPYSGKKESKEVLFLSNTICWRQYTMNSKHLNYITNSKKYIQTMDRNYQREKAEKYRN